MVTYLGCIWNNQAKVWFAFRVYIRLFVPTFKWIWLHVSKDCLIEIRCVWNFNIGSRRLRNHERTRTHVKYVLAITSVQCLCITSATHEDIHILHSLKCNGSSKNNLHVRCHVGLTLQWVKCSELSAVSCQVNNPVPSTTLILKRMYRCQFEPSQKLFTDVYWPTSCTTWHQTTLLMNWLQQHLHISGMGSLSASWCTSSCL